MKKIGIIPNISKPGWLEVTKEILTFLKKYKIPAVMEADVVEKYQLDKSCLSDDLSFKNVDMVISLGGDGTILSTIQKIKKYDLPIFGVNLGTLGFLTEFSVATLFPSLELVLKGEYEINNRMTLEAVLERDSAAVESHIALNDIVITYNALSRPLVMKISIDEEYLTTYKADGVIVSTPTGSTAYSLSAGGPIVHPELEAVLLTPICPHTLTNRPILINAEKEVKIQLIGMPTEATLTVDGQLAIPLQKDDIIKTKKSPKYVRLITTHATSYLDILKSKLGWKGIKETEDI